MIVATNIVYKYRDWSGAFELGPLSFDLPPGKVIFWVGPNGSGKSTLARILCGEIPADHGSTTGIDGASIYYDQTVLDNVFPDLTVSDHLRLLAASRNERLDFALEAFPEVCDLLHHYPDELSGGQLQILAFVSVLLKKHRLYIFDEVLNHLHPRYATTVLKCIKEFLAGTDHSHCVVISHDLLLAQEMADIVHIFEAGQIVRTVSRADLKQEPNRLSTWC